METFHPAFDTLKLDTFENNVAAAFKCEKCTETNIPINPYSCDKGHVFCKKCLDDSIENKEECPNGNHEIVRSNENVGIKHIISSLKIACPMYDEFKATNDENDINGDSLEKCQWKGTVSLLFEHLPECQLYIEFNKIYENDIKITQFKQIIDKLTKENISMKQSMDKMALQIINIQKEMTHNKQNLNNSEENDNKNNLKLVQETSIIGDCTECNKNIEFSENEMFNIKLVNNKWQHIDCDYNAIKLDVTDTDLWCDKIASDVIHVYKRAATLDPNSTVSYYHGIFGLITVKHGDPIKEWKVRINKLKNNNIYIGIINALKVSQSLSNNAYQNGISLHGNGTIYRFNKDNYQCGYQYKQGDIISIILDVTNRLLVFKINDNSIVVSVSDLNIDLTDFKWKLYALLYNPDDQIIILNNDDNKDYTPGHIDDADEKKNDYTYSCNKCNASISTEDFHINNIYWSPDHEWEHNDCELSKYKLPDLLQSNEDIFNKLLAFKDDISLFNNSRTFMSRKSSVYQTVFGVISVKEGQKVWNIEINTGSSNMYIGIIESDSINTVRNNIPTNNAYYLAWNGQIGGSGLNKQSGISYTTGDVISIILDLNKYTLGFGKNNNKYFLVKDADLKKKSFNVFCTMYAVNNGVSILSNGKDGALKSDVSQAIDVCSQCNNKLFSNDFDIQNVVWNKTNSKWNHINCNLKMKLPELQLTDTDVWHPYLSNPEIKLYDKYTSIGGGNGNYWNVFGVISVDKGIKKWDIKINVQPSQTYIGIIDTTAMKQRKVGIPSNCGYYLSYNGYIQGKSLNIPMSYTLKVNDIVTIILDKNKKTLCFGVNYKNFKYAKGAVLHGSYNLFCTSYYQNTSFTILGDDEGKDDEKEEGKCIGQCMKCKQNLFDSDLKSKNLSWDDAQNKWCHTDCNFTKPVMPKLNMTDIDQWNPKYSNDGIQINDGYNFIGGHSTYFNTFGVISVKQGVKVWSIKINQQPSYVYIGIIDSNAIKTKQIGIPSNNGYYLTYNGYIQGRGLSIPIGYTLKVNDKIKIILDLTKHTLCFGINDKNFVYAKGAMLRNRSFNLFSTSYYQNTSITILGKEVSGAIGGYSKGKMLYKCGNCSKGIYEMDFEINNVKNKSNTWYHIECNLSIPNLSVKSRDQWNKMISNRDFNIQSYDASLSKGGGNFNAFGIITITKKTKRWNVKIVNQPSGYVHIGIIDSNNLNGRQVGIPSNDGYYLSYNGYIQGSGLNINAGLTFKTGDIINVLLDINKGVLSFGRNNSDYAYAKDANIKGRSFNLFCNMRYANTKVTIQK